MPPVRYAASLLRSHAAGLRAVGIYEAVVAQAPARLRKLLESPPLPTSWLSLEPFDDLWSIVEPMGGLELVRKVSFEGTRRGTGPLLTPLAKTMLSLFGATPATVFARLPSLISIVERGADSTWTAEDAGRGTLEIVAGEPHKRRDWEAWAGALGYVFELTQKPGQVAVGELTENGRGVRLGVAWL